MRGGVGGGAAGGGGRGERGSGVCGGWVLVSSAAVMTPSLNSVVSFLNSTFAATAPASRHGGYVVAWFSTAVSVFAPPTPSQDAPLAVVYASLLQLPQLEDTAHVAVHAKSPPAHPPARLTVTPHASRSTSLVSRDFNQSPLLFMPARLFLALLALRYRPSW
uniref:Uncharacterized protein n=1 Tax=Knipowitschia caucasica TaxID=637954 RepID=A0AAV2L1Y5_KNICA